MDSHTDCCRAYVATQEARRTTVLAAYPRICRTCGGRGGWMSGYRYAAPPEFTPCPDCEEQGRCPRCAACMDTEEDDVDYRCPACGWIVAPQMTLLPLAIQCICSKSSHIEC